MSESRQKRKIFFGMLDWGLGHVTRSIPVVSSLLEQGHSVTLGASGFGKELLRVHFPQLSIVDLPSYRVNYRINPFWWGMVLQLPRINKAIQRERRIIKDWAQKERPDIIISDNRLGLFHPSAHCVYMTHQLQVPFGALGAVASRIHRHHISHFQELWIPDDRASSLSGKLSSGSEALGLPVQFIGHPSRFGQSQEKGDESVLILLSGPEPRRSSLEKRLLAQAAKMGEQTFTLVRGTQAPLLASASENVRVLNWTSGTQLEELLRSCSVVVARSGYSTLLDLCHARKPLVAIPTPGQGEQVYLGKMHSEAGRILCAHEDDIDLGKEVARARSFAGRLPEPTPLQIMV